MASKFCTSCGSPIAEGKRFCGKCGKPIPQKQAPSSESTPSPPPSPTGQPCTQCGFPIPAGKRFCIKCGKAVGEATPAVVARTDVPAQSAAPSLIASTDAEMAKRSESVLPSELPTPEPPRTPVTVAPPMRSTEPAHAPAELSLPVSGAVLPKAQKASASSVAVETPRKRSARGLVVAVVLLAIVAGGAVGVWFYRQQTSKATVASAPSSIPALSAPAAAPATTSESNAKAVLGVPAPRTPSNAVAASTLVADGNEQSSAQKQSSLTQTSVPEIPPRVSATTPRKEIVQEPTPASLTVPATPTAGDLHYVGPPVHFGELVVFQHLPAGRLRFAFDHQAWQPLISRQPDGSQTLTLRSLRQIDQTECNVHWELAP